MFDEYIRFHARSRPRAPAVNMDHGTVDFSRFDADIDRAALQLESMGVLPEEVVSVSVADEYRHWVIVLGLARLGVGGAFGINTCRLTITDIVADDRKNGLVLDEGRLNAIFHGPSVDPVRRSIDPAGQGRILKTSGTTGDTKRIGMSWRVIDAGIRNALIAYGAPEGPWMPATGINTILGFVLALACWASGNAVILSGGELSIKTLTRFRPRLIAMVPNQLDRLLNTVPRDYVNAELRVITGGGSVPPELARRTRQVLTADLRSVYGAAETGAVAIADLALLEQTAFCAGYILPTVQVEVVDELGNELPRGSLGRLRLRGDRVADRYLDDAERSTEAFRDGWFYSNDLGRIAKDGLLTVEGRRDDLMNLGGHKVLPGWIETIAAAAPGVTEVCAFSLNDESGLERLSLALVCTPSFSKEALAQVLCTQLAWLGRVELFAFNKLPRNHMGKIERNRIRDLVISRRKGQMTSQIQEAREG